MFKWINIVLFFSFTSLGNMHPVHVSVSNLEYFKDKNKIELSIKIFEDDFRLLFFHLNEVEVDLRTESNYNRYKELIKAYFETHFILEANNENALKLTIVNWKINDDAIWFNLAINVNQEVKYLKITNKMLLDLYFDQKNLLILETEGKEVGYQFDYKITEKEINLK